MASGTAAAVKLYATGLQRPRVLTVKIELMSACGPSRHFAAAQRLGRFRSEADINWQARSAGSVANGPKGDIGDCLDIARFLL
jgi:hypothetical protein